MKSHTTNVNEDYLWDQTGDPDPEIQELEQVLGTLSYQPRQLVIPASLQPDRKGTSFRSFRPILAIAAAIVLAVGAGALWLSVGRREAPEVTKGTTKDGANVNSHQAAATVTTDVLSEIPGSGPDNPPTDHHDLAAEDHSSVANPLETPRRSRHNRTRSTKNANQPDIAPPMPVLAANELKEAEAGKAKLMLALRVASAKLNFALRKAQGTNNGNLIHNQHKIG
jgi:hypothetical protein